MNNNGKNMSLGHPKRLRGRKHTSSGNPTETDPARRRKPTANADFMLGSKARQQPKNLNRI